MNQPECPGLNAVEADVNIDYNQESKIMTITLVWHKPVSSISVPIEFIQHEHTTPGGADDPV